MQVPNESDPPKFVTDRAFTNCFQWKSNELAREAVGTRYLATPQTTRRDPEMTIFGWLIDWNCQAEHDLLCPRDWDRDSAKPAIKLGTQFTNE